MASASTSTNTAPVAEDSLPNTSPVPSSSKICRLHLWGASTSFPTLDPVSLYAATLIRSTPKIGADYTFQLASATTSTPRVPLVQIIETTTTSPATATTTQLIDDISDILSFSKEAGLDSSLASDPEKSSKAVALHAFLDDQLLDLTLHSLFSFPTNYRSVTVPAYSRVGPAGSDTSSIPFIGSSIPSRLRNAVEQRLTSVGLWGLGGKESTQEDEERNELAGRAGIIPKKKLGLGKSAKDAAREEFERSKLTNLVKDVLDVVDAAVGEDRYALNTQQVGSLDAHIFGFLAPLLYASPKLPNDTVPKMLKSRYPRLVSYLARLKEQLWPDDDKAVWPAWVDGAELKSVPLVVSSASTASAASSWWPFGRNQASEQQQEEQHTPKASFASSSRSPDSARQHQPRPQRSDHPAAAAAKKSRSPEEKRLAWGRAIWICTALLGVVGYTFASGIPGEGSTLDLSTMCKVKEAPSPFDLADTRPASASSTSPRRHHIVTGTFNSTQLFVLEYDDLKSRLSILQEVDAEGPHQYLAMGRTNTGRSIVYATTWGQPAALSSWIVGTDEYHNHSQNDDASTTKSNDKYHLSFGNRALITATGSYVHVQPPSYHTFSAPGYGSMPGTGRWLGSAGGPTGELHRLDPSTGLIGEKVKELIFLSNPNELETADKSRKALRYGAHSFDCTSNSNSFIDDHHLGGGDHVHQGGQDQTAFVADLGSNSVKAYSFPQLEYLYEIPSGREHDGPRHSIPHPTLPLLFTVTEHTNYVDWFQLPSFASASSASFDKGSEMAAAKYLGSVDMLLPSQSAHRHDWRGDTLRLSTDARYLFATTRGKTEKQRGWLVVYKLVISEADNGQAGPQIDLQEVERFETRTSGGKANAIELAPPSLNSADSSSSHQQARDLLVLTDDEQGWIDVLEWNPTQEKLHVKATIQLPKLQDGDWQGASHAIWID